MHHVDGGSMSRFSRQIRLAEVGELGQARLAKAVVPLAREGFAREVEAAYLRAAGVGVREEPSPGASGAGDCPTSIDLGLRHRASQEVADGAWAALVEVRRILLEPG